jgi:hypothetical protein
MISWSLILKVENGDQLKHMVIYQRLEHFINCILFFDDIRASYETRIFLIGGNDGNKKNNDLYSIVVLDSRYGEFSSLPDLEERVANFDIENKLEFIDSKKVNDQDIKIVRVLKE